MNTDIKTTPQLVDVDEDVPLGFGRLKVGFTPGVDGKTRRVCCMHYYVASYDRPIKLIALILIGFLQKIERVGGNIFFLTIFYVL